MLALALRASLVGLAIGLTSSPAFALKVDLPGTRSKEYIKGLCSQVQGQYLEGQWLYDELQRDAESK